MCKVREGKSDLKDFKKGEGGREKDGERRGRDRYRECGVGNGWFCRCENRARYDARQLQIAQ